MLCHCDDSDYIDGILAQQELYLSYEESDEKLTWCSGCGNYGIQKALVRALALEELDRQQVLLCYDIGCSGNESDKLGAYTIHGLHGRVLPLAAGASLADHKKQIVAIAGDGATFSEGVNHLVHTLRNDYDVLFILHNNENYGLTTGQASAMTRTGQRMNGSPDGVFAAPMNACHFALSLGPTFVARGFSGDVKHMTELLRQGLRHNGFAFVELMQVCPTYNKATSQRWFWDRIRFVEGISGYDPTDIKQATEISADLESSIAMGVLYRNEFGNFYERLPQRQEVQTTLVEEVHPFDVTELMAEFR